MEGDVITTQEIFRFQRRGIAADGTVVGQFEATRRSAPLHRAAAGGGRGASRRHAVGGDW